MDAAGLDRWAYEDFVRLIARAIGARARIWRSSQRVALAAAQVAGVLLRDVVVTREELDALDAGLLVSHEATPRHGPVRGLARRRTPDTLGQALHVRGRAQLPRMSRESPRPRVDLGAAAGDPRAARRSRSRSSRPSTSRTIRRTPSRPSSSAGTQRGRRVRSTRTAASRSASTRPSSSTGASTARRPTRTRPPTCSTSSRGARIRSSPGCAFSARGETSSRTS